MSKIRIVQGFIAVLFGLAGGSAVAELRERSYNDGAAMVILSLPTQALGEVAVHDL